MDKTTGAIIGITVLVFAVIIIGSVQGTKNFKPGAQCVQHSNSLSMHIHPVIEIYLEGEKAAIPANIGIDPTCMKAVHTHDESGTIHIESPQFNDFKLADFFENWGVPFTKDQILDKTVDDTHTISLTVDGQPSEDYENLIMRDGQQIVIRYDKKQE